MAIQQDDLGKLGGAELVYPSAALGGEKKWIPVCRGERRFMVDAGGSVPWLVVVRSCRRSPGAGGRTPGDGEVAVALRLAAGMLPAREGGADTERGWTAAWEAKQEARTASGGAG